VLAEGMQKRYGTQIMLIGGAWRPRRWPVKPGSGAGAADGLRPEVQAAPPPRRCGESHRLTGQEGLDQGLIHTFDNSSGVGEYILSRGDRQVAQVG